MFYVYVLKSLNRNYIYVWLTNNLERRVGQHQGWKVRTTKPYSPFVLLITEEFNTRMEARTREKQLKSWYWKEYLKNIEK